MCYKKKKGLSLLTFMLIFLNLSFLIFAEETVSVDLDTVIERIMENDLDYRLTVANYERTMLEYEKERQIISCRSPDIMSWSWKTVSDRLKIHTGMQ